MSVRLETTASDLTTAEVIVSDDEWTFTIAAASDVERMQRTLREEIADGEGVDDPDAVTLSPRWEVTDALDLAEFEEAGAPIATLEDVAAIMAVVEAADAYLPAKALACLYRDDAAYAASLAQEYEGHYNDLEDFGRNFTHDLYDIPDYLQPYIDYEKFGRDLAMDYTTVDDPSGGFWAFRTT